MSEHDVAAKLFSTEFWPNDCKDEAEEESQDEFGGVRESGCESGDAEDHAVAIGEIGGAAKELIDRERYDVFSAVAIDDITMALAKFWQ